MSGLTRVVVAAVVVLSLAGVEIGSGAGTADAADATILGFGRHATGGAGGTRCVVTTTADAGPQSLRDCATRPNTIVTFGAGLAGRIILRTPVDVANSVTIEGPAPVITNGGRARTMGLVLAQGNVILRRLVFSDWGDWRRSPSVQPFPNPVFFDSGSDYVVDQVTFRRIGGKVGIRCASGITIAWSHFAESDKGVQVGDFAHGRCAWANTLTLHHNWFDRIGFRAPRTHSGNVHLLNNLQESWGSSAASSVCRGQLASEANVFRPARNKKAIFTDGRSAKPEKCILAGYARSTGDLLENGAFVVLNGPDRVFDPARAYDPTGRYVYPVDEASPALASVIKAGAGAE